jgi:hypothetical protein
MMTAATGSMTSSFIVAAILLSISGMITLTLIERKETAPEGAILQPGLGLTMADGGEKIEEEEKKK